MDRRRDTRSDIGDRAGAHITLADGVHRQAATIAETTLALARIVGIGVRWAAFGSAALLFWFATAMVIADGLKSPLDYSVYSASACALLLALHDHRRRRLPQIIDSR